MQEELQKQPQFADLYCQRCELRHERVKTDCANVPLKDELSDSGFKRLSLCPQNARQLNLTCAHTTARTTFSTLLKTIPEHQASPKKIEALDAKVKELDLKIIQVDIRKSDAEVQYAKLIDLLQKEDIDAQNSLNSDLIKVESTIAQIVAEHHVLVDELQNCLNEALKLQTNTDGEREIHI